MERISASLRMINVKEEFIYLEGTVLEQTLWAGWENIQLEQKLSLQKEKGREKTFHAYQRHRKTRCLSIFCRRIVFGEKREKTLH